MCTCLKKSEEKIFNFVKEGLEKERTNIDSFNKEESGYVNQVLTFGDVGSGWKLVMPFEVKYTPRKKNGELGRECTYKTNIFPAFCPFCGKKQKEEK